MEYARLSPRLLFAEAGCSTVDLQDKLYDIGCSASLNNNERYKKEERALGCFFHVIKVKARGYLIV